jgi:hypothetical protein
VSNKEDGTKLKKSPLVKSIYFVVCISWHKSYVHDILLSL